LRACKSRGVKLCSSSSDEGSKIGDMVLICYLYVMIFSGKLFSSSTTHYIISDYITDGEVISVEGKQLIEDFLPRTALALLVEKLIHSIQEFSQFRSLPGVFEI
jgi:hypothetical protein